MSFQSYQIVVLGTGFAGTITGLILKQLGYDVALVDRCQHPRFAIGESSTPIADRILSDLCDRYDLADIQSLTTYGTATKHQEEYFVGPKRGFSYFSHTDYDSATPLTGSETLATHVHHEDHQLLVAASQSRDSGDTHWHRASVDHYLVRRAKAYGIATFENVEQLSLERNINGRWDLRGRQNGQARHLRCEFVIDATGRASPLARFLKLGDNVAQLRTASGAVYAHFQGLKATSDWFRETHALRRHPFPCDEAAVHQVTPQGWMWQLRFDHQITSCGWGLPLSQVPDTDQNLNNWWRDRLRRFPLLEEQFSQAEIVAPQGGLQRVPRLQYLRPLASGNRWAMLPSSVGFIDPLHSSGIAHAMASIEQLTHLFPGNGRLPKEGELAQYSERLQSEFRWIDRLISTCYDCLHDFQLFQIVCMAYFLCVIHYERSRNPSDPYQSTFLSAGDQKLQLRIRDYLDSLPVSISDPLPKDEILRLHSQFRKTMEGYNHADLLSSFVHPFYHHTTAPGK